jgi:tetratricopeptide (TPR) repeat protein
MKKVVLASLLAVAGAAPLVSVMVAQQPAAGGAQQPAAGAQQPAAGAQQTGPGGGQIQMSADEYAAYNNANTQTTPAAKAAAFEAYLKAYPNSAVKGDVLNQMLFAYSQAGDQAKTLDTADRLLTVDPNNMRALTFEVYYRRAEADKMTDPAAKQAALDKVAQYAQTGLDAPKPKDMSDADFEKLKTATMPTFESAVADDDLAKKDNAGAITALKKEIDANQADTQKPSPVLQDVYVLAQAYYTSTPPDYLDCTWYATRAAAFAPDAVKAQIQPLATYCYTKYHGSKDGYETVQTSVQTNLDPPSGFLDTIKPAPKPEDIVSNLISTTPDLATLALSDKEFVLQYGKPEDAEKVFDTVKGKAVEIPGAVVVAATPDQLQVAVSDDAKQAQPKPTADFTFNMKAPLTKVPNPGDTITLDGTYASYTQSPLMITMSDGAVVEPKKTPAKTPARRPATRRPR